MDRSAADAGRFEVVVACVEVVALELRREAY